MIRWLAKLAGAFWLLACCIACSAHRYPHPPLDSADANRVFLRFDRDGVLTNPSAIPITRDIINHREQPVEQIVVMALGWGHRADQSESLYEAGIQQFLAEQGKIYRARGESPPRPLFICVVWNSRITGFTDFLRSVNFIGVGAERLGEWVIEPALYPLTYWAMSDLADRIGNSSLRTTLEQILDGVEKRDVPPLYMFGHSFGSRMINGLLTPAESYHLRYWPRRDVQPFRYAANTRCAVLVAAPISEVNTLGVDQRHKGQPLPFDFPVVVTVNKHDYSQTRLFPIGNLIRTNSVTPIIENERRVSKEDEWGYALFVSYAKTVSGVASSWVLTPLRYYWETQARVVWHRHIHYPMDTLAHLPVVGLLPQAIDRLAGGQLGWGIKSRGFFEWDMLHASVSAPGFFNYYDWEKGRMHDTPLPTSREFVESGELKAGDYVLVDISDASKTGTFGQNVHNPWSYPLNMIDILGTHRDYKSAPLLGFVAAAFDRAPRPTKTERP